MKTEHLRFKLGIKLYRLTGHVTHFVRDAQDEYMRNKMNDFLVDYLKNHEGIGVFTFEQYISLQIGTFQVEVGLHRRVYYFERGIIGKVFRVIDRLGFRMRMFLNKHKI